MNTLRIHIHSSIPKEKSLVERLRDPTIRFIGDWQAHRLDVWCCILENGWIDTNEAIFIIDFASDPSGFERCFPGLPPRALGL